MKPIKNLVLRNGALLLALAVSTANGEISLETLYSFGQNTNYSGASPNGLMLAADGNFYGTTLYSGTNGHGTIFRIGTNGVFTLLVTFDGTNGDQVVAPLVQGTNGILYGATFYGGNGHEGYSGSGYGTAFQVTTNGLLTSLTWFTNDGVRGFYPGAGLVQGTDGLLYGTTVYGGTNGYGTVYSMTAGGVVNTLFSFANTNGNYPLAALVQAGDGNLYGTTAYGGTNGNGTIFRISTNGVFACLMSFRYSSNGSNPRAPLVEGADGALYGTTDTGGTNNYGTVFKFTTNGVYTQLHALKYSEGGYVGGLVRIGDSTFYGTTRQGGTYGDGTIFKITTNGVFTNLYSFSGNYDGYAPETLVAGPDGNLYGTALYGGTNGSGTIFRVTTNGLLTTLYTFEFNSYTDGATPEKPVQGAGGLFYGVTQTGEKYGFGSIYTMSTNGTRHGLYAFTGGDDGGGPLCLVQARDGCYYGGTAGGGTNFNGTIFKVTTGGAFTVLYNLNYGDGYGPNRLIQGLDGNLYGTADTGGTNGYGTIYKVTTNGAFALLYSFNSQDGSEPGGLLQGADGNFYGFTYSGGSNYNGTIFKVTSTGTFTSLYSFNYDEGFTPNSLVLGLDGNLYGTTEYGGTNGNGTIFKITTEGVLTSLYQLNYSAGYNAYNPYNLMQGSDGNLYGCTYGGYYGNGSVFKIKTNGTFSLIYDFDNDDGSEFTGLVQGKDGNIYGTTRSGGMNGAGSFFRLNVPASPSIVTQPADLICLAGTTATFTVEAEGVLPLKYRWQKNSVNLNNGGNISGATSSTLTSSNLSLADSGIYSVVISNNFGSVTSSNATLIVLPHLPEALDATNLVWITGGAADWFGEPWAAHDGVDAGESGLLMDSQEAWMETTVTGPGTLTFWWSVSSEPDYDLLVFSVNDEGRAAISGETGWQQETFQLGAGSLRLSWTYAKDLSVTLGADCGWVDQVSFVSTGAGPVFQRVFQTNNTFNLEWSTVSEKMYQVQYRTNLNQTDWIDLGTPATNGTLSVPIGPDRQRFFRILEMP